MPRDRESILDALAAAKMALEYVSEKDFDRFLSDTQCQDAVIRRLEVLGEAAGRVSAERRNAFPEVPWQEIIGMRNVMIHQYDSVDLRIVWDTLQTDLPRLIEALEDVLKRDWEPAEEP
jgi:uncharacterized protein with HEPN domain